MCQTNPIFKKTIFCLFAIIVCTIVICSIFSCGGSGGGDDASSIHPATLTWDPPTTNADGTPLTDLAGYNLYYGTSPGNYTEVIDVGNVITYTVTGIEPGKYYFAVTAYNTSRIESGYSNEVRRTIK